MTKYLGGRAEQIGDFSLLLQSRSELRDTADTIALTACWLSKCRAVPGTACLSHPQKQSSASWLQSVPPNC